MSDKFVQELITELKPKTAMIGKSYPTENENPDAFDVFMAVEDDSGNPFVVFVECESREETEYKPDDSKSKPPPDVTNGPKQSQEVSEDGPPDVTNGPKQSQEVRKPPDVTGGLKQFNDLSRMIAQLTSDFKSKDPPPARSLAAALMAGRWCYVYLTTRSDKEQTKPSRPKRCLILERSDAEKCLGPMWPLYKVLRDASQAKKMPKDNLNERNVE